jgi:putative transposase
MIMAAIIIVGVVGIGACEAHLSCSPFPPEIIRHAVWLYLRFTLSYRDVEDLLAERGLIVSNESMPLGMQWVDAIRPTASCDPASSQPK